MTRMYVVLTILFALVFWAGALLGQQGKERPIDEEDALIQKRLKMREEMHRRMMDKLLHGFGPDQDMFSDMEKMMEEMMDNSLSGFSIRSDKSLNFSMEWLETKSGRTLVITPKDPSQNLDISVSNGMISIKGKSEQKTPQGVSVSNFTNSFNVPSDCDETKVKMDQKDGKILIQFPYQSARDQRSVPKKGNDRRPVHPTESDVHI